MADFIVITNQSDETNKAIRKDTITQIDETGTGCTISHQVNNEGGAALAYATQSIDDVVKMIEL